MPTSRKRSSAHEVARVATARGGAPAAVQSLVDAQTEGRQFGFFGEPRVNVLILDIALDSAFARSNAPQP